MAETSSETVRGTTAQSVSLNAFSNAMVVAFDMVTSLVLMAFILRVLTREMYGVWAVTGAVFAYSTLLQLGLNSAVNFFVPSLLLEKNYLQLSRVASTALAFYCVGAVVLIIATVVVTVFFPVWFQIPDKASGVARTVVLMVGVYFILAVPLSVFQGLLSGMQRYVTMNVTRLVCRLARVILIVVLLLLGFGLVGLAIGHVVTRLAESLAMPFLVRRYLPELSLRPSLVSWSVFKQMFGHSGFTLLWSLAALVRDRASFVVIGVFLSAGAAGSYQIPVMLMRAFDGITQALAAVTKPATSAFKAEGRSGAIESLVLRGGKCVVAIFIPVAAFVAIYADIIIPIWVGDQYTDASGLVILLLLAQAPLTGQAVTTYVLIGMDHHRTLAMATLGSALAGVFLMTWFVTVEKMGLWGVACGASFSMVVMGVFVLPILACRALEIRWGVYVRNVFATPVVASLPFVAIVVGIRCWAEGSGLWRIILSGLISLPVLIGCYYVIVLSHHERQLLLTKLRGVLHRRTAKKGETTG